MPVHNAEIARALNDYADLLEISGANQFRVRAYRTAARNISELPHSISEMVKQGEPLSSIPGLGKELTAKVEEMATSGSFSQLEEFKKEFPVGLLDITKIGGLGPRRTRALYQELGITDIEQLARAAKEKRIRELPGFAAST
ncbi:MAG: helix-hairpin-helix domain-containing protein, partial [Dehalococcoidales bacterium]